ncbi:HTH-type transcriptional repressor glcR [Listeria grayi]|uniref:HTH deoR-type domain-containing protein n=1 Tax=Listeria grayi FSL F6-1183 TaxID=1265827 RepID=A0A829R5Y2_LISGR|nr:DeoR/GlpR family DNA-binding transcription regulator [Listeria grayi]EUJ26588.1 hypothetical protein LMUR_12286 [Listeria grayi FSL F6-1183]VEI35852.1 HTH-type transcriptional repressor glcR [Listeria grayi]
MLNAERQQLILTLLKEAGTVKTQELVSRLDTSESTIRRDLDELEEANMLKRVHGGATLLTDFRLEPSMTEKSAINIQSKKKIASYCANLVQENDCIYLDAGSTTFEMIDLLKNKNIIVVTNGLMHVEKLVSNSIEAYLLGGKMKARTKAIIGATAVEQLGNYHFDKAFIGTNGIHPDFGYTTPDIEEAHVKQTAQKHAAKSYVLADASKLDVVLFAKMFTLDEATLVIDRVPNGKLAHYQGKSKIVEVENDIYSDSKSLD